MPSGSHGPSPNIVPSSAPTSVPMPPIATPIAATVPRSIFFGSAGAAGAAERRCAGAAAAPALALPACLSTSRCRRRRLELRVARRSAAAARLVTLSSIALTSFLYGDQNASRMLIGFVTIFVIVASQSAVAVVEDAVAADEHVVRVAVGERGGDLLRLAVARDVAVHEVRVRRAGERAVLAGVDDRHAEVERARVEVQRAGLEHAVLLRVEVGEVDEVAQRCGRSRAGTARP